MGVPFVPKSVTLNDPERRNGRYFALFQNFSLDFRLQLPTPMSPDEFLVVMGASICGAKRVGRASTF